MTLNPPLDAFFGKVFDSNLATRKFWAENHSSLKQNVTEIRANGALHKLLV